MRRVFLTETPDLLLIRGSSGVPKRLARSSGLHQTARGRTRPARGRDHGLRCIAVPNEDRSDPSWRRPRPLPVGAAAGRRSRSLGAQVAGCGPRGGNSGHLL